MPHPRRRRPAALIAATIAFSLALSGCQVPVSQVQRAQEAFKRLLNPPPGGFVLAGNIVSALRTGDSKQALVDTLKLVKELRLTDALGKTVTTKPDPQTGNFELPVAPGKVATGKGPVVAPKRPGKYSLSQASARKGAPVKLQVVLSNGKVVTLKYDSGNKALTEYIDAQLNGGYDLGEISLDANAGTANAQNNPLAQIDSDGDGQKDAVDTDDDGDKAPDAADKGAFAYDDQENADNDGDGVGDVRDTDDDNDGKPDASDPDDDGDKIPDARDTDDDGDGLDDATADIAVEDNDHDVDEDGLPDEADADDDGDGTADKADDDADGDGTPNASDTDDDNDQVVDDAEPKDADDDGVADYFDPNDADAASWEMDAEFDWSLLWKMQDADFDFVDDAKDPDADGDGTANAEDMDDDGDGWSDSDDLDENNNGIPDQFEDEGADGDGDGIPDAYDSDDNNDESFDTELDAGVWAQDSDGDGVPDWEDYDDDGDEVADYADDDDDGDGTTDKSDQDGMVTVNMDDQPTGVEEPDVVAAERDPVVSASESDPNAGKDSDCDGIPNAEDPDEFDGGCEGVDENTSGEEPPQDVS